MKTQIYRVCIICESNYRTFTEFR